MNLKPLSEEYKTLRRIGSMLDQLMSDRYTKVEIDGVELYDHLKKEGRIREEFPDQKLFYQFIRKYHLSGEMKSFIPNYHCDTSIYHHFKWTFYKKSSLSELKQGKNTEVIKSKYKYHDYGKTIETASGEMVRSKQEKKIYDQLYQCDHLDIYYEHPLTEFGETRYVDFYILNKRSHKKFFWEHFGMTNDENYVKNIPEKEEWYRNNGFVKVENGGNFICTYYDDDKGFQRDIVKHLGLIIS